MNNKKGLTLIELLIVISIITILATSSINLFNLVQKRKISKDIDTIISALNSAKYKAFVEKRTCGLWWNNSKNFKTIELRCDSDNDGQITDNNGYDIIKTLNLSVAFQDGNRKFISFLKEGITFNVVTLCPKDFKNLPSKSCILVSNTRILRGYLKITSSTQCNSTYCIPNL